jgi:four helix bundle protein
MAVATKFEELLSWQRMHELNVEVIRATESGPASRDFKFRDEIRDAADSAERNVAEGFARYNPPVFANFLDYSRASAAETRSMLKKGVACGYFSAERYLRSPQAKRNAARRYSKTRAARQNDSNE